MFNISKFDNFIFDLDGTLVDTAPRILECLREVLHNNGYEQEALNCTPTLIGPPLGVIIKELMPACKDVDVDFLIGQFRQQYNKNPYSGTNSYAYAQDLLSRLRSSNKKLFVATNKPLLPTQEILNHYFPNVFDAVYTPDYKDSMKITKYEMLETIVSETNVNRDKMLFIGDTQGDLMAASKAKIPFAFVSFGYEADKQAVAEKSDYVIENYKELL